MKTLTEALTESTQDLKVKYLAQVEDWAKHEFENDIKCLEWNEITWCKHFNLTPELANYHQVPKPTFDSGYVPVGMQFWSLPRGFYNTRDARKLDRMKDAARSAQRMGVEEYVKKAIYRGELHYKSSVAKLAERLVRKGIEENRGDEVKIEKGWIGVNLELVISVDKIRVKAWTIVAEGIIQRPHYRYLVK